MMNWVVNIYLFSTLSHGIILRSANHNRFFFVFNWPQASSPIYSKSDVNRFRFNALSAYEKKIEDNEEKKIAININP